MGPDGAFSTSSNRADSAGPHRTLGLDQGPSMLMIENYRSEFVWQTMKRSSYLNKALERAGFTGGWLDKNIYKDSAGHSAQRP